MPEPKRWLDAKEAAEHLGVSLSMLYQMVGMELVPHYRLGLGRGKVLFKPADLDSYLESRRRGPAAKKPAPVLRPSIPIVVEDRLGNPRGRKARGR